jgi:hypothetical protein
MARAKTNRTRIITRESKILPLRRRRMMVLWQNHLRNEGFLASRLIGGILDEVRMHKHDTQAYNTMVK